MKHIYYNVKEPKMFHKKRLFFHFFLKSLLQHLLMGGPQGQKKTKENKREAKGRQKKTKQRQKEDKRETNERQKRDK